MKICHITSVHPRKDVRIIEKECVSLSKAGYDVYEVVNDDESDELYEEIHIISTRHKPKNRYERIFKSAEELLKKALEVDAEIYHLHDPELLQIVDRLKRAGKKVIFDAHEDTELQILDKSWIPAFLRKPIAYMYGKFSMKKMGHADGIVTVTPALVDKYQVCNANVVMVTNYPILKEKLKSEVKNDDENYVFFAGGVTKQWCHEIVSEAVKRIAGMRYLIAGRANPDYIDSLMQIGGVRWNI